ncbi:MAG: toxic anion resistance protein, partial [Firmicutes bacterium]|nr:toxic anion resistance protein [Bacillota bacterium]
MTDEIKIPEEAENLQELVEEELEDVQEAAEEVVEEVEAEVVEADPEVIKKAEELKAVQEEAQAIAEEVEESEVMKIADKVEFTTEELAIIDQYAKAVDLKDTNRVLQFGADAQEKLAEFSESALTNVRTSDLGTIGDSLSGLVTELKGFSATEERKGLAKLFHKALDPIEEMKNRYDKANNNVEKVVNILDGHQVTLTKDIAVLDELFKANTDNFKNLSMYIAAGKQALKEA